MQKRFLCFVLLIIVIIGFSFTAHSEMDENSGNFKSPLILVSDMADEVIRLGESESERAYMKMDAGIYQELKERVESDRITSINDFPLSADTTVTIEDIQKVETFAEHTVIYHGYQQSNRASNIVAFNGKIAETGDSIFLTLSPRGVYGFSRDTYGKPTRSFRYVPNSKLTVSFDASREDMPDINLMDDMIETDQDDVFEQSPARDLPVKSYYRIAVDTTEEFLDDKFDGDTDAAEDYIFSLFAYINPPFNEFKAHLFPSYIRLWPKGDDIYYNYDLWNLHGEFTSQWGRPGNPEYDITRHTAIMLCLQKDNSTVGLAGINTICKKAGGASNYQGYKNSYEWWNYHVVAHELGHVFGSGHFMNQGGIMSYDQPDKDDFYFCDGAINAFNKYRSPENDDCAPLTKPGDDDNGDNGDWIRILDDDFESGYGNWNDGGTDSILYKDGTYAFKGDNAVNLQDNSSSSKITTDKLDLSGYSQIKVDFAYYAISMDSKSEDFWLQISTNGGSSYTTVKQWDYNDEFENGKFYQDSAIITGFNLTNETKLRFRCDASGNSDDIYIDEVVVSVAGDTASKGISNISAASGKTHTTGIVSENAVIYSDRDYKMENIPSGYTGLDFIKGHNEDKDESDDPFLTFDINGSATIYLVLDTRRSSLPGWTSGWNNTGDQIDSDDKTYDIYSKSFSAGSVELGPNNLSKYSMYWVMADFD